MRGRAAAELGTPCMSERCTELVEIGVAVQGSRVQVAAGQLSRVRPSEAVCKGVLENTDFLSVAS